MDWKWLNALVSRSQSPVTTVESDLERCRRAIKLYLDTLHTYNGKLSSVVAARNIVQATEDAPLLSLHGNEGIRLGGRGSVNVKLKYWRGSFSISRGEASDQRHRQWEDEIGTKFKEARLPFNYHFPKE